MPTASYEFVNEAITQLFVGVGLALLNVLICYFAPRIPKVISILHWNSWKRAALIGYLIALTLQLVTSPFFASAFHPVSIELAWSPYQAIFNVLGVIVIDVISMVWEGARKGAEVGRQQFDSVKARAAEGLEDLSAQLPSIGESREAHEARRTAEEEAAAQTVADRKERLDDKLKDY
jgi:hypothetical protein